MARTARFMVLHRTEPENEGPPLAEECGVGCAPGLRDGTALRPLPRRALLGLTAGLPVLLLCLALYLSKRWPGLPGLREGSDDTLVKLSANRPSASVSDFCGRVDQNTEYHTQANLYWVGNIASPDQCCAECDGDPECGAWTYMQQSEDAGMVARCYLKVLAEGEEPERIHRWGVVSGRVLKRGEKHGVVAELLAEREGRQRPKAMEISRSGTCPGRIPVGGYHPMHVVSALYKVGGERAAPVDMPADGWAIMPRLNSRAYLAENCTPGVYSAKDYAAMKLLGKTLRYTVDLSRAGCGCNAQMHLIPMHFMTEETSCKDYFCSHGWSRCGGLCADIGVQDSNKYAWSSQLHLRDDGGGASAGYGGGTTAVGRRSWSESQYGPGARCIDTTWPFDVEVSFPVDKVGILEAMEVKLSQDLHYCPLRLRIDEYSYKGRDGLIEISQVLEAGVTPTVRYWSSPDLKWMDGAGPDGQGPCVTDAPEACPESVRFYNFAVGQIASEEAPQHAAQSLLEEALEDVHKDLTRAQSEDREREAAKIEDEEELEDRISDPNDRDHGKMFRMIPLVNASVKGGRQKAVPVEANGVKQYDEIINGNVEWEAVEGGVPVLSEARPAADVLETAWPGEVFVGRESHGFLQLLHKPGYVSLKGLRKRVVSYAKIVRGSCADVGKFPILDAGSCAAAALALGYFDTHVRVYSGDDVQRPGGCYLFQGRAWLATNPAMMHNGADSKRQPLCSSGDYQTTTTTSTTITTTMGHPSLFCIEVTRAKGYEFPLVQEQMKRRASIFACDDYAVFSDGGDPRTVGINPDGSELKTIVIPPIHQEIGNFAAGATTNSWLNTKTFLQVWDLCKKDGRFSRYDWSVKVDPDAVFFPSRLRPRLKAHTWQGANFYIVNCNRWGPALFGSMEIFSKQAVLTYLTGQHQCRASLPWKGWGEDYFMSHCFDMLGVGRIYDFDMLSDKRCMYSPCSDTSKVAFHDYKDASPNGVWFQCWQQSSSAR